MTRESGEPLHPETGAFLTALSTLPPVGLSAHDLRGRRRELATLFDSGSANVTLSHESVAGVPVGIYSHGADPPLRAIVFVHGGGWVAGDLVTHDGICRRISAASSCVVIAVDYRQPPESPWPAAVVDVLAVIQALLDSAAYSEVAVAGDSSGAHVAVQALLQLETRSPRVSAMLLIQPACDPAMTGQSWTTLGVGHFLTARAMTWFWDQYLAGAPRVPLWSADLSTLPAARILTSSLDPSKDEAHVLADQLKSARVSVEVTELRGFPHGCFTLPGAFPSAMPLLEDAAAWLGTHP